MNIKFIKVDNEKININVKFYKFIFNEEQNPFIPKTVFVMGSKKMGIAFNFFCNLFII